MDTYKRNQLEWALWRLFRSEPSKQERPPTIFRNRIKRLLELDRERSDVGAKPQRLIFFDEEPEGRGSEARFSVFNGFMMAVALDLLDIGFKQAEIVHLLGQELDRFKKVFRIVQQNPPSPPDLIAASDRPDAPVRKVNGEECADCAVFMVLEKIELTEVIASVSLRGRRKSPTLGAPNILRGIDDLTANLEQMGSDYRKVVILELADMAVLVGQLLAEVPAAPRGRR